MSGGHVATARTASRFDPLWLVATSGGQHRGILTVRGWTVIVLDAVGTVTDADALDDLGTTCGWRQDRAPEGTPPFVGGAVGYLTEDAGGPWLALPPDARPVRAGLGAVHFAVHDTAICLPPDGGPAWLVAADLHGWSRRPRKDRLAGLAGVVDAAADAPSVEAPQVEPPAWVRRSLDEHAHRAGVERALGWIGAGDLYQLNLTLQIGVPWPHGGVALARRLWDASPAAGHQAYLSTGDAEVVSISPETFLAVDGDRVAVCPIKGTRPRSGDEHADAAAALALEGSAKDRAEHVMIVDLERNDLGKVCEAGSVTVPRLAELEAHPTVWHLTSTVEGRLRGDTGLRDLLSALFPCGSVTGAPKRMAVARTRALEPTRRGVYCGAIGVVSRGLVDMSVGIRTAVLRGGVATYGTGGGIVADSDPADEYAEAMDKAAAFLRATGAAHTGVAAPVTQAR